MPELAAVLEAIATHGGDTARVRLCLDTAHLWGAGHDISHAEGVGKVLDDVAAEVGIERVAMIHLNDSRSAGCGRPPRTAFRAESSEGLRAILTETAWPRHLFRTPGGGLRESVARLR